MNQARRTFAPAAVVLVMIVGLASLRVWLERALRPFELGGVRLGDGRGQVRQAFSAGAGVWATRGESLGFRATDGASPVTRARFDFHDGLLVGAAVEARPSWPGASGLPLEISAAAVVVREVGDGRARVRLLSRDCPDLRGEVERAMRGEGVGEPVFLDE